MSQHGRTIREEASNAITHLPVGCYACYELLDGNSNTIFLLFSAFTFFFSFLYHITRYGVYKTIFRRLDIASIFWLVAASVFAFLPAFVGLPVLVLCFLLSIPVVKTGTSTIFTDSALIILTIACFMLTVVFSQQWPIIGLGVLFYGCGLPFYFKDETKWAHLIWHLFVIAGWLTHLWAHL